MSNINSYVENLKGSPYLTEASLNPFSKMKQGISNFINRKPPQPKLQPVDQDFIKIVEKVCEMIIHKIDTDYNENHSKITPATIGLRSDDPNKKYQDDEKAGLSVPFEESIQENDDKDEGDKEGTSLPVANTPKEANGWLDWFHGQYRRYRTIGLNFYIEDDVKLSNGTNKLLRLKWSNNRHENKIIVNWKNEESKKPNPNNSIESPDNVKYRDIEKSGGSVPLEEVAREIEDVEDVDDSDDWNSIVLFRFFDDQVSSRSPSFKEPSVALLLTQANRYSPIINRIKNNADINRYSKPLFDSLYRVVRLKDVTEFKGHDNLNNTNSIRFKIEGNNILYTSVKSGKTTGMNLKVINSILEKGKESNDDPNLKDTGCSDYHQFVNILQKSGFNSDLVSDIARNNYNNELKIHSSNEEEQKINDAIKALIRLDINKSDAEKSVRNAYQINPNQSVEELVRYGLKNINENLKEEYKLKNLLKR